MTLPSPPLTALSDLQAQRAGAGWAVPDAAALATVCGLPATELGELQPDWQHLPPDPHRRGGGRHRHRQPPRPSP